MSDNISIGAVIKTTVSELDIHLDDYRFTNLYELVEEDSSNEHIKCTKWKSCKRKVRPDSSKIKNSFQMFRSNYSGWYTSIIVPYARNNTDLTKRIYLHKKGDKIIFFVQDTERRITPRKMLELIETVKDPEAIFTLMCL